MVDGKRARDFPTRDGSARLQTVPARGQRGIAITDSSNPISFLPLQSIGNFIARNESIPWRMIAARENAGSIPDQEGESHSAVA